MNLRTKTLLIMMLIFVIFIALIYILSNEILVKGFVELEKENVCKESRRAVDALYDEIYSLDKINYDWAAWNDTYEFIKDANEEYIESNLIDSTFTALDLNVMLFFNVSGYLIYGKAFDLQNESQIDVPDELLEYIYEHDFLLYHNSTNSSIAGIILINGKIMMISSRPILTSNDKGPIRGALIMSRYLDEEKIKELSEITHLPISMHLINDSLLPESFRENILSIGNKTFVHPLNKNTITGFSVINLNLPVSRLKGDIGKANTSL